VPGGSLLIIGGYPAVREVVRIDTRREFAVAHCAPMLTPRWMHAAVYPTPHLYILGGRNDRNLSECERLVCPENRWEALPSLPRACQCSSGVVVESSLYALGGYDGSNLDSVQKLSLETLTWELMQFRLPFAGYGIPCFKLRDTEVYLEVNKTLCSFTAFDVRPLKTLTDNIPSLFGTTVLRTAASSWAVNTSKFVFGDGGRLMLTLTTLMISVLDNIQRHNDLHKLDLTETRWHKLAYSQLSLRCPTTVKTPEALNLILLTTQKDISRSTPECQRPSTNLSIIELSLVVAFLCLSADK
jgi:hypothetical protein